MLKIFKYDVLLCAKRFGKEYLNFWLGFSYYVLKLSQWFSREKSVLLLSLTPAFTISKIVNVQGYLKLTLNKN